MDTKRIIKGISMISQVGCSMIVPIFISGAIGYYLTNQFHTAFWFIFFILLGILAGFRNTYLLIQKIYHLDLKKDDTKKYKQKGEEIDDNKKE